jgi:hypothetical protein
MKYKIVNNEVRVKYVLHTFTMSDCEDPELYAAQPIYEWQQTPAGKFCMKNATELEFHTHIDHATMGYKVAITGYITEKHATFYALKKS